MAFTDLYPIKQDWLPLGREHNRPGTTLNPQGMVIHDTDDPGATDENEETYFKGAYRASSAHTFIDWDSITEYIPENEEAWHAGPTANSKYLGEELCVPPTHDPARFVEVWKRGVWYTALKFFRHGWETGPGLWSHRGVSNRWRETDHQDPISYFAEYGKSWDDFVSDVNAMIVQMKGENDVKLKTLVLYYGDADLQIAADLAQHFGCPLVQAANATSDLLAAANTKYQVGGATAPDGVTLLGGADRFDTMKAVLHAMGKV